MRQNRNRRAGVEDLWTKAGPSGRRVNSARHGIGRRWRARFTDDQGQEKSRAFDRKVDAQVWLAEISAALVTGLYVDPQVGRTTFEQYFAEWATRQVWVSGTDRAMRLAARSVTFAHLPLAQIRRSHVEQWVKGMLAADRGPGRPVGLAPGTIHTRFVNVRSVLSAAVKDRAISRNPSDDVRLPRQRRQDVAMRLPTTEQVFCLLGAAEERWRALFALCAFAGLRLGEAAALRVSDVDFLRRTLQVSRQVQRVDRDTVEIRAPKYGSERAVYLADGLLAILAEHVGANPGDDLDRWMFYGTAGRPPHQNSVGHQWRAARTAASLPDVRLHDLRHYYASGLIAAGCDVVTVQRAMGHASATVTLSTYSHLWPTAEDRTRQAVEQMMTSGLEPTSAAR